MKKSRMQRLFFYDCKQGIISVKGRAASRSESRESARLRFGSFKIIRAVRRGGDQAVCTIAAVVLP